MIKDNLQNYFRGQQISLQWLPVLRAMANELAAHTDSQDLHRLFVNIGENLANNAKEDFNGVQTLDQLETTLNDFWWQINWGWVELNEVQGYIDITHQASPLAEGFGQDALSWSTGLLEGFYQTIFAVLGAGEKLVLRRTGEVGDGMTLRFRFGL